MINVSERKMAGHQSASGDGASLIPAELSDLNQRIAIALHLLPRVRSLSRTDQITLAVHLRVLSNAAEAWAQRKEQTQSR